MLYQPKMMELLVENARDFALVMLDTQGHIVSWNTGAENVLGWNEAEIVGQPAAMFFTPEDQAAGVPGQELRAAREQGRAEDERWYVRKDDSRFWGSGLVQPVYEDGTLQGYIQLLHDLTAHSQANIAVRRSEARFRAVQDASVDGFMTLEAVRSDTGDIVDFRWIYVNEAAARIVGHPRDWFLGRLLLEVMPGNREEGLFDAYARVVETGEPYIRELQYDHEGVHVYIRLVAVKALDGFGVTFADLTERQQAQDALRRSEAHFRALSDAAPSFVWRTGPTGEAEYVNRRYEEFVGLRLDQIKAGRWHPLLHPDDQPEYVRAFTQAVRDQARFAARTRIQRHDGVWCWIESTAAPLFDAAGGFLGHVGISLDVHDRIEAEGALRDSETHFRALADNIAQLAWMADGTGYIFWYNRRWHDYTGTTREEMQGWGWSSVHHPDYIAPVTQRWSEHLSAGQQWEDTFPLRSKDGEWRWFLSRAFPIRDEAGNVALWFGTNTDVSEQRGIEEDLRHHQAEIEALNVRLARAMRETHHRVKNNLQVIAALVELQSDDLGGGSAVQRLKQHVRALATIHDMLTQQAKADTDTSVVSARDVLLRLIPVLQETSGERRIQADIAEARLSVQKATSLALLVSECVGNAIKHATGEVEITLEVADGTARLEVCDDGPGFPPDFDPRRAANTGLELIESTARWDLRGELVYENREQGGGRVVVTFPLDAPSEA